MMKSAILRIAVVGGAAAAVAVGATGAAGAATASSTGTSSTSVTDGGTSVTSVSSGFSNGGGVTVLGVGKVTKGQQPVLCRVVPWPVDKIKGQVKGQIKGRGPGNVTCIAPGRGEHIRCIVRVLKKGEIEISCTVNGHQKPVLPGPLPIRIQPGGPILPGGPVTVLPNQSVSVTSGTVSTQSAGQTVSIG